MGPGPARPDHGGLRGRARADAGMSPEISPTHVAIGDVAVATLTVPGYPDFLAAEDRAVWTTNTDRVEKLVVDRPDPIATIEMPSPCGAMVVAEGSMWAASCREQSVYRLDTESGAVLARIPTG